MRVPPTSGDSSCCVERDQHVAFEADMHGESVSFISTLYRAHDKVKHESEADLCARATFSISCLGTQP